MGLDTESGPAPVPDNAQLLQSARVTALRAKSPAALRQMIMALELACETARQAALRNFAIMRQPGGTDIARARSPDRTCGFADLFAALRRVRVELDRRQAANDDDRDKPTAGRSAARSRPGTRPLFALRPVPWRRKPTQSKAVA
jgi:hypothetical protein